MVRIGNSRIDGQGLFAAQDITQGTRIIAYIGEKIACQESARRLEAHVQGARLNHTIFTRAKS